MDILKICCSLLFQKEEEKEQATEGAVETVCIEPKPLHSPTVVVFQPTIAPAPAKVPATSEQKTFKTSQEIPKEYFRENRLVLGCATMIMDGDSFKFYQKAFHDQATPKSIHILKQETWSVRVAGIDCPEVSHGEGKPAMPFGEEAKEFVINLIKNKPISLVLLDLDQYQRVVASVRIEGQDLSCLILKAGLAHLYTGKGAHYASKEKEMRSALEHAKKSKLGIWSQEQVLTPAEYKRAHN
jgi:endonuclease YncB( thermonuclease family)